MSSLSIPPLPSDVLRERAMVSAVSETMLADWAGTRKKEKLDGLSWRSQKTTPDHTAVTNPAGIWIGKHFSTINLCWRYDLASDEFFCSKKVRASGSGSVGVSEPSVAEPARMSCLNRGLRRVSKRFLVAADDAAWFMIEFDTNWPSLAFIWSMTLGGPVRSSNWTVGVGVALV